MPLPNFFILGAAKCGTSSLWSYLQQHPQIWMSKPKEPNFMAFEGQQLPPDRGPDSDAVLCQRLYQNTVTELAQYESLFIPTGPKSKNSDDSATLPSSTPPKILGEASVRYLYHEPAIARIAHYTPNAKFVVMLRHPVERIYSHYLMNRRHLLEPLPLSQALEAEPTRIQQGWGYDWHYRQVSTYSPQLRRYLQKFSPEQIKVVLNDDLRRDPAGTMQSVYQFLEIDDSFIADTSQRVLSGHMPKSFLLHRFWYTDNPWRRLAKRVLPDKRYYQLLDWVRQVNRGPIPQLSPDFKQGLRQTFEADIQELETLLQRPIPW